MTSIIDAFMDRYRGTRGVFGWIVFRADVRYVKRFANVAKAIKRGDIR